MQNRKDRRLAEKQMGMRKMEKNMSKNALEEIKARKKEYVKQVLLLKAQEDENKKQNYAAESWSKQMEHLLQSGHTRESATAILEKNRDLQKKVEDKKNSRLKKKAS